MGRRRSYAEQRRRERGRRQHLGAARRLGVRSLRRLPLLRQGKEVLSVRGRERHGWCRRRRRRRGEGRCWLDDCAVAATSASGVPGPAGSWRLPTAAGTSRDDNGDHGDDSGDDDSSTFDGGRRPKEEDGLCASRRRPGLPGSPRPRHPAEDWAPADAACGRAGVERARDMGGGGLSREADGRRWRRRLGTTYWRWRPARRGGGRVGR